MTQVRAGGPTTQFRPEIVRQTVVFGRMYEDAAIEGRVLPMGRVLCIASAGDTAFQLAETGRDVVAVDLNAAQVHYVRARLDGAPAEPGSVERMLGRARRLLALTAWRRPDLARFCALTDPAQQQRQWCLDFDTPTFRAVLGVSLSPLSVKAAGFAAFTRGVGARFDTLMRERLLEGLGRHVNRDNPYLRALLLGELGSVPGAAARSRVEVTCTDVAEFLESSPAGSFDGFALSNVLDGANAEYCARLAAAVRHASAPGAVAVWRTFRPGQTKSEREWAARDRSMLWGGLRVTRPLGEQ